MATHFPLLSYHVDMSNWIFQEAQDVDFPKMYGRNCHPSGTGFRSGPWTIGSKGDLSIAKNVHATSEARLDRENYYYHLAL